MSTTTLSGNGNHLARNTSPSVFKGRATPRVPLQQPAYLHVIWRGRSCANGWDTENHTASIPGALAGGAFIGSAGEGRFSSAARADFADAAMAVLTSDGHAGKIYELAGDDAYTLSELAAEISRQTGKSIPYKDLPEADYAAALAKFGLPEALAKAVAGWDVAASQDTLFDESRQLSALIGRPTTSSRPRSSKL